MTQADRKPVFPETAEIAPVDLAPASIDAEREPPTIAGRYEILGLVGMGGMGSVYRVRDRVLDEIVALKFLKREAIGNDSSLGSASLVDRLRDEAKLARRVTHVNVARTFDVGEHEGERFLTMEYVDGESLARVIEREGRLGLVRVVEIARGICAGLSAAHAAGVVHRDLKPDNVLLARDGRVVISDFGIARSSSGSPSDAMIVGTAAYMAPEQLEGKAVDARADIYALGVVLFEMLTGVVAWSGTSDVIVAARRLQEAPPDPRAVRADLPSAIAEIVMRCMARAPDARYRDGADVMSALDAALQKTAMAETIAVGLDDMPLAARAFRVAPGPQRAGTTVAVLPFRNQGPAEDAFLAEELTDELIDALSMTGGLRVRPRRMVEKHASGDLAAIGRELDVNVVIEGTLRRANDRVRISARALGVAEGLQIWAQRFERPASELLATNDEIARAIAQALASTALVLPRGTPDAMAAELYVRARHVLRRAWTGMGDLELAVELFRQGVARAPDDPSMISGYAMALARRFNYRERPGPAGELGEIRAQAERAIALAPHLGEPWLALATLSYVTSDWPVAVRTLREALRRAPGLLRAHDMLGHIEIEVGRIEDGLFRLENVLSLDPSPSAARWQAAMAHALRRRWDRAYALLDLPVEGEPDRVMRLFSRARMDAMCGIARYPVLSPEECGDNKHLLFSRGLHLSVQGIVLDGVVARVHERVAALAPNARLLPLLYQLLAEAHTRAGDHTTGLASVRAAIDGGLFDLSWLNEASVLDPLRSEPGWPVLRARVEERVAPIVRALDAPLS